ncbi:PREDICTED: glucose-6-phosphate translocase-like [Priapulus caudatus]|uniref:Glucose-6-phosphate translocase-like n=1 Tax=Priapulus caudatus TaxID=37621 RepID=A0ABM1ECV7_PRICU|nr:PREDICTED: glucose-6-phosphate translocase-like [Priapulus caudatus]XP_014670035.1 PREDICTED: glucose-6-phosphate translocase-like [Priapulus caudatus]
MASEGFFKYQLAIFVSMYVGYMTYMYDRRSFTYAFPALIEEGFDKSQLGLIVTSQTTAYAVSKFLGGVLSDKISAKILFASGLFVSGLVVLVLPLCNDVMMFTALWFMCGLAQGCGWPSCAKVLRQWWNPAQFGTWWSILSTSQNVSGSVAPLVAAFLITNFGWRYSLQLPGVISLGLAAVAVLFVVDKPSDVGLENIVKDTTQKSKKGDADTVQSESTWKDLLKSPFLWLLCIGYLIVYASKTAASDWGQLYVIQELGGSQYLGSAFISSVETGGVIGSVIAGYLTDWLVRRKKSRGDTSDSSPRMIGVLIFVGVVFTLFHALVYIVNKDSSEVLITGVGFCIGLCLYGAICIFGVVASECAPTHLSGTSHAFVALAANLGGMLAGLPLAYVAKHYNWSGVFLLIETLNLGYAVILLFMLNISSVMVPLKKKHE